MRPPRAGPARSGGRPSARRRRSRRAVPWISTATSQKPSCARTGTGRQDPLGIRPDVASFAALLASSSLEPPLAIGLFGPWGSGKTTFLKRLRLAIDKRAAEARSSRAESRPTPFVGNVVQVEFNAWHFAEDALISSLVDTIVRELRAFIKNDYPAVGQALANLKSETLETARRRVDLAKRNEADARQAVANVHEDRLGERGEGPQGRHEPDGGGGGRVGGHAPAVQGVAGHGEERRARASPGRRLRRGRAPGGRATDPFPPGQTAWATSAGGVPSCSLS